MSLTDLPRRLRVRIVSQQTTGCWLWVGRLYPNGYAQTWSGSRSDGSRKNAYGHRLVYQLLRGEIPAGLDLDHLCRVRSCVNPDHLDPVTRSENIRRGEGPRKLGLLNGSKTRCARGHEFTLENTHMRPTGGRSCRACAREDARRKRTAEAIRAVAD